MSAQRNQTSSTTYRNRRIIALVALAVAVAIEIRERDLLLPRTLPGNMAVLVTSPKPGLRTVEDVLAVNGQG